MTSSACPNCSPRLPNEAAHTLNRVLLLRPRPVPSITKPVHHWNADHPEARTRQNRHFFSTLLVEVVGGGQISEDAIKKALTFYESIGKKPIHIRREVKGHVANRLQAALWREAFHLVEQGIASVEDVDTAIAQGPGLRWALLGPF